MAKLLVFFFLLLLQFPRLAPASDFTEKQFARANAFNREQRFAQAIPVYESLQQKGVKTAALYNNLAIASYHAGEVGKATWYFEKARFLAPLDPEIYQNQQALIQKNNKVMQASFSDSFPGIPLLMQLVSKGLYLGTILLLVSSVWFLYSLLSKRKSVPGKALKMAGIGVLVVLLCLAGIWTLQPSTSKIVVLENTTGFIGPSGQARPGIPLKASETATVTNAFDGWLNVKTLDGQQTWVRQEKVGRIFD